MTLTTDLTHQRRDRTGPAGESRTIILPVSVRDVLVHHARQEWPRECCGALLGSRGDTTRIVARAVPATNITQADPRVTYHIDWGTLFRATREARNEQTDLLGFYHSHPDGSVRPSRRDRETAWIDYSYVIVSIDGLCRVALTSWCVPAEGDDFEEETLRLIDQPCRPNGPPVRPNGSCPPPVNPLRRRSYH